MQNLVVLEVWLHYDDTERLDRVWHPDKGGTVDTRTQVQPQFFDPWVLQEICFGVKFFQER